MNDLILGKFFDSLSTWFNSLREVFSEFDISKLFDGKFFEDIGAWFKSLPDAYSELSQTLLLGFIALWIPVVGLFLFAIINRNGRRTISDVIGSVMVLGFIAAIVFYFIKHDYQMMIILFAMVLATLIIMNLFKKKAAHEETAEKKSKASKLEVLQSKAQETAQTAEADKQNYEALVQKSSEEEAELGDLYTHREVLNAELKAAKARKDQASIKVLSKELSECESQIKEKEKAHAKTEAELKKAKSKAAASRSQQEVAQEKLDAHNDVLARKHKKGDLFQVAELIVPDDAYAKPTKKLKKAKAELATLAKKEETYNGILESQKTLAADKESLQGAIADAQKGIEEATRQHDKKAAKALKKELQNNQKKLEKVQASQNAAVKAEAKATKALYDQQVVTDNAVRDANNEYREYLKNPKPQKAAKPVASEFVLSELIVPDDAYVEPTKKLLKAREALQTVESQKASVQTIEARKAEAQAGVEKQNVEIKKLAEYLAQAKKAGDKDAVKALNKQISTCVAAVKKGDAEVTKATKAIAVAQKAEAQDERKADVAVRQANEEYKQFLAKRAKMTPEQIEADTRKKEAAKAKKIEQNQAEARKKAEAEAKKIEHQQQAEELKRKKAEAKAARKVSTAAPDDELTATEAWPIYKGQPGIELTPDSVTPQPIEVQTKKTIKARELEAQAQAAREAYDATIKEAEEAHRGLDEAQARVDSIQLQIQAAKLAKDKATVRVLEQEAKVAHDALVEAKAAAKKQDAEVEKAKKKLDAIEASSSKASMVAEKERLAVEAKEAAARKKLHGQGCYIIHNYFDQYVVALCDSHKQFLCCSAKSYPTLDDAKQAICQLQTLGSTLNIKDLTTTIADDQQYPMMRYYEVYGYLRFVIALDASSIALQSETLYSKSDIKKLAKWTLQAIGTEEIYTSTGPIRLRCGQFIRPSAYQVEGKTCLVSYT